MQKIKPSFCQGERKEPKRDDYVVLQKMKFQEMTQAFADQMTPQSLVLLRKYDCRSHKKTDRQSAK